MLASVEYDEIAPFVGLTPGRNMNDIKNYVVHPPVEHETEEVRFRFMSPVSVSLLTEMKLKTGSGKECLDSIF
jgi:hypothetical protein